MTTFCSCDTPIMDVEHDAGCRRCGLPVDFTPKAPGCAVCGGPDDAGNGCEFCPAVDAVDDVDVEALRKMTDDALRSLIEVEREQGRAFGEVAEAARILLALRMGAPS